MLSLFVVSPSAAVPPLDVGDRPDLHALRTYELEDVIGVIGGQHLYEYDLVWKDFPPDLERIVTESLVAALQQGATVAWFAFEGSFSFEYLLHPNIANDIYAVAAGDDVWLAVDDDYRSCGDWQRLLTELRESRLGAGL